MISLVMPLINVEKCFEPHFHRAYSNVVPIVELWNIPVADCLVYCITNSVECHSVVYHKHFFTCQLYKKIDESSEDSNFVFANGHDFFKRISFSNDCQTNSSTKKQKIIQENTIDQFKSKVYAHAIKSVPIQDKSNIISIDNHEIIVSPTTQKPIKTTTLKMENKINSYMNTQNKITFDENNEQILFFNPPISKFVLSEIKLGFFKISNVNSLFIPSNSKSLTNVTESECLETCKNKNNIDEKKSFCQSAIYNKNKKSCIFLTDDTKEFRRFTRLIQNEETTFYDKMAMPINTDCKRVIPVFNVFMNKISTKNIIQKYPSIDKLKDCITLCAIESSCSFISYSRKICSLHSKPEENLYVKNLIENGTNFSVVVENNCI